jgi:hypothetical protein
MSKEIITISFSPAQAKKIVGKGVSQLSHEYITGKKGHPLQVQVRKSTANRLRKAAKAGKSARIRLDEMESIEGAGPVLDWLKKIGKQAKQFYDEKLKPTFAPIIKEGVGKLADMGAAAAAPFLPAQVNKLIQENKGQAVDWLGSSVGAYGVMGLPVYGGSVMMPFGGVYYPQPYSNWSVASMPMAPAMMSKLPWPGFGASAGVPGGEPVENPRGSGFRVI